MRQAAVVMGALLVACSAGPAPVARDSPGPAGDGGGSPRVGLAVLPTGPSGPEPRLALHPVVRGLDRAVHLTAPPGDERLSIVEQDGRIRLAGPDGALRPEPFLDLRDRVKAGGEQGLLGLAFHPDYARTGRFFVYYTSQPEGDSRLEEYRVSADADRADRGSGRVLLEVDQPSPIHNGGMLAFGPDGLLYLGLGYGGTTQSELRWTSQDPHTLLGSILRLDVDASGADGDPYAIPPGNPFADGHAGAPEVWAYGLRNPWRFSFDPVTDLVYIADVGQYRYEEINVVPARQAGLNFGWPLFEGRHCLLGAPQCSEQGLVAPILEYTHEGRCAVIGGLVYRGSAMPGLVGRYFYTDHCGGGLLSFRYRGGTAAEMRDHTPEVGVLAFPTSFGTDARGELYVAASDGVVYRLVMAD